MYDKKSSIEYIESRFPALSEDLQDETWEGLIHLQVAVFSHLAQDVINSGDRDAWQEVTEVFMDLWRDCTPDVENALNVSFLEHLNFVDGKKKRSWAYQTMPEVMRKAWDEMEDYNRRLHGGEGFHSPSA